MKYWPHEGNDKFPNDLKDFPFWKILPVDIAENDDFLNLSFFSEICWESLH